MGEGDLKSFVRPKGVTPTFRPEEGGACDLTSIAAEVEASDVSVTSLEEAVFEVEARRRAKALDPLIPNEATDLLMVAIVGCLIVGRGLSRSFNASI